MHRKPDATGPDAGRAPPSGARRLLALLRADEVDAAIDAGLMAFDATADAVPDAEERQLLLDAQQRLRTAWDARERYRARGARLARRKAERDARRAPPPAPAAPKPALPPAAAAALARARAKAGGR